MKKSNIILLHLAFWSYFAIDFFFKNFLASHLLSFEDYSRLLASYPYVVFSYPFFLYFSYFYILKLIHNPKALIGTIISLIGLSIAIPLIAGQGEFLYFCSPYLLISIIPSIFIGASFRLIIEWIKRKKQQLQLSKQNLQSELTLLRNQLSPHFLFNSLHNIDTLISTNPEKASDSLLKLSDMMRYMLYEADSEKVTLKQETEYLKKYIGLQQLRLTQQELVSFHLEMEDENIQIAPMLFIPFVENAFKHTTDKNTKNGISITIKTTTKGVVFEITNIFDKMKQITKDASSGIGLHNVKRRLELLYPGRHHLEITQEDNCYHVILSLQTDAN